MSSKLYKRIFQCPKSSFFLFGPRGTGKTTLVRKLNLHAKEISLLSEGKYQSYLANPSMFYEELSLQNPGEWIFVDEIQRLPNLLNEIHRLIEDKKLKFILTGSSARKLRKHGVNLLAGRALYKTLYPLTPMEMGDDFCLNSVLRFGSLPLIINSQNKKETLRSYVQIYLKEEIQSEAIVRNLGGFSRFLPVAALFHAQIANLSNIARECEVARPTVVGFFQILIDTLLLKPLSAYDAKLRMRERKKSKYYFIDPGLVRAIKSQYGYVTAEEKGSLFEGLIFTLLNFQKDTYGEIDDIYYWSPADAKKTEVDFLVVKGNKIVAIEVKASEKIQPQYLKGLKAISSLKNVKRRILIYLGKTNRITKDGVEIHSFKSFVKLLKTKQI